MRAANEAVKEELSWLLGSLSHRLLLPDYLVAYGICLRYAPAKGTWAEVHSLA